MKKIYTSMILMAVTIVWGDGFAATGGMLGALPLSHIMITRFIGAAVFPLLICWKKLCKLDHATIGHGIMIGISLLLAFASQTFDLKYLAPSENALLTATNVMSVPYLLRSFRYQRPPRKELIVSLLCIVGIVLLASKKGVPMLSFSNMLSLVCALFFALYIIAPEHHFARVGTACMTASQTVTVGVISMICALTLEQPSTSFNWHAVGNVIYLIFASTLLARLLQTFTQKSTTTNSTSLILPMEALSVSILSFLSLGEIMSPPMILGACPVFSSILCIGYKSVRKEKDRQQDIY